MSIRQYLPSAKFATMIGALGLSGGLVLAAQALTAPPENTAQVTTLPVQQNTYDWQAALADVESQSNIKALEPLDQQTVNDFLAEAQGPNLTDTVGRTLLINLSNAKSQGLGDDIPTQEQIIAAAAAQVKTDAAPAYTTGDLTIVAQSNSALRTYGNKVIETLYAYPEANPNDTYAAVGAAADTQSAAALKSLPAIGDAYRALAKALKNVPVPSTLSPLHLQMVNDFAQMADSYADMETMVTDPLRGLAGVQRYASLLDEATRVLTSIAGILSKDGILFTKDEPGSTWNAFLSS